MTPAADAEAPTRRLSTVREDVMEADNVVQKRRGRVVPARDAVGNLPSPAEVKPAAPASVKAEPDAFRDIGGSAVPAFNSVILRETFGVIWVAKDEPDGTRRHIQSAAAALRAFRPADEIEGKLAAQATAMHFAAMECFRRSILNEQPADIAAKLRKDGANLARAMTEMLDALDRKRGKGGQQKVTVEHVHVHSGGQAIVGAVTPTAPGGGAETGGATEPCATPAALDHDATTRPSLPALRSADAVRRRVPIARDAEWPVPDARRL